MQGVVVKSKVLAYLALKKVNILVRKCYANECACSHWYQMQLKKKAVGVAMKTLVCFFDDFRPLLN